MVAADITIKENYLDFINKATKEFNSIKKEYTRIVNAKESIYQDLLPRKEIITINLHIDLDIYTEFTNKEFNDSYSLYNRAIKVYNDFEYSDYKEDSRLLLKWCSVLNKEREVLEHLYIASKKVNMNYKTYREYVFRYSCALHKFIANGKGYQFQSGLGTIYAKVVKLKPGAKVLDYAETRKNKERFVAEGRKIYNKKEAEICDALGYEYDGEDYRIFTDRPTLISFKFVNSKYFSEKNYEFRAIRYIHKKYRGNTYKELIANNNWSVDDIYNLRVDLRTKIALLLLKDKTKYFNLDRKET